MAAETSAGISVFTSLTNPYAGGRFYFPDTPSNPVSINNPYFAGQDMLFRIAESGPAQQIAALQLQVNDLGPGNSLTDKLNLVKTYLAVPDIQSACAMLQDFKNQVRAQSGKKLTVGQAEGLTTDADALMTAIGCT